MGETFYSVLGVDRDADAKRIKEAYRDLVKDHHPDVSDDDDAAETFKRLTEARDVLVDPPSRKQYDRVGHDAYVHRYLDSNAWTADPSPGESTGGPTTDPTGGASASSSAGTPDGDGAAGDRTGGWSPGGSDGPGASERSRERRRSGRRYGGRSETDSADGDEDGTRGEDASRASEAGGTAAGSGDPFDDVGGAWTTGDGEWSTSTGSTAGRAGGDGRRRARADGWRQRHAAASGYSPGGRESAASVREHASLVERLRSALRDIGPWLAFHFAFLVSAFVTIWLLMSWSPSVTTMLVSFLLLGVTVFSSILHMISRVYS